MAQIYEEEVTLVLSKLVKTGDDLPLSLMADDQKDALAGAVEQMIADDTVIVEIKK
jgi:hypothetical protein